VKAFLALIVGALIGAAAVWYIKNTPPSDDAKTSSTNQVQDAVRQAGEAIQEQFREWNVNPQTVKDELARSGQVVRRKTAEAGKAIADATLDARITAAIKGKLLTHTDLSSLSISVNTTDGVVTMSGAAPSTDYISKAIVVAMETEGVREVVSTIQVRAKNPASK
jgi:hypothetical protein